MTSSCPSGKNGHGKIAGLNPAGVHLHALPVEASSEEQFSQRRNPTAGSASPVAAGAAAGTPA